MLDGATVPAVVARTAHSSVPSASLDRPADILTVTRGRLGGTSRTRSKTRPGPLLLLLGQVGRDNLEVVLLEFVYNLVGSRRPAGQGEQGGGTIRQLLAHLLYEVVADPDVCHRPRERSHPRAHRRAEEGHEEDQPDQETPEGAAERASAAGAVQLAGVWLLVFLGPADHRG